MKRITILTLLVAFGLTAIAQKSTLNGTLAGAAPGARLLVAEIVDGKLAVVDTLKTDAKGRFKMERTTADEYFAILTLAQPQGPSVHLVLLPDEKVTLGLSYRPDINMLQVNNVKGSANMKLYQGYNNLIIESRGDEAAQAALPDSIETLLRATPGELMSAFLVTFYEEVFEQYYDLYKTIRNATVDRYPDHPFVKHIDQKVRSVIGIGEEAPDIELPDPTGKMRKLSDLRGQVVLIDFWASWCGPCRRENPSVVRLYQQFHNKGFEVFSVSLDQSRDKWVEAINVDRLFWPNHVSDLKGWSSAGGRLYGIMSIPATVLVDREGRVLARNLRGQQLENKLKEIFNE